MNVTLRNKTRGQLVYNLTHEAYCKPLGKCECREQTVRTTKHDGSSGDVTPVALERKFPPVLTLLPFERRSGIPEEVVELPPLVSDRLTRKLQVFKGDKVAAPSQSSGSGSVREKKSKKNTDSE